MPVTLNPLIDEPKSMSGFFNVLWVQTATLDFSLTDN